MVRQHFETLLILWLLSSDCTGAKSKLFFKAAQKALQKKIICEVMFRNLFGPNLLILRAYFEKEVSVEIGWNVSNQRVTQN